MNNYNVQTTPGYGVSMLNNKKHSFLCFFLFISKGKSFKFGMAANLALANISVLEVFGEDKSWIQFMARSM